MKAALLARLAWKGLASSKSFTAFFVANVSLGLLGFLIVSSVRGSIARSLSERSKLILTADLSVSARRDLNTTELEKLKRLLPSEAVESQVLEMYSMVSSRRGSRLVEVVGIDERYPFYGEIALEGNEPRKVTSRSYKTIVRHPETWISPELALQLGVQVGDSIKLGNQSFKIVQQISQDSGSSWRGVSLAPRIYVGRTSLISTGLVRPGSTITYRRLYKLPESVNLESLSKELNRELDDPAIQITTHQNASEQVGRVFQYLGDYLALTALVALLLAGLGGAYLFRNWIGKHLKELAVLRTLGLTPNESQIVLALQLVLLGIAAATLASAVSAITLPLVSNLLSRAMSQDIQAHWVARDSFYALCLGIVTSALSGLPLLARLRKLEISTLFQEMSNPELPWEPKALLALLPSVLTTWGLAVAESKSIRVGTLFTLGFFVSAASIGSLAWAVLPILERVATGLSYQARLALRSLARQKLSTFSCFMAIGLGTLLISLIPQIQRTIESEIQQPEVSQVPSLFLFDIQDDQVDSLKKDLQDQGVTLASLSPLVRARLEKVNGESFSKHPNAESKLTREAEQEARFRNRGFNLTYREKLTESETIVAGEPIQTPYSGDGPALVSVEFRFAERLGLKLHDLLSFDVQGVPVEAKIVNLRKIEWTSFQPNFFVQFQPGVLEEAPKTFLATVPQVDFETKTRLQNRLVDHFPNVSMVDVTSLVERILSIFAQMSWAIRWMAVLSLLSGLAVLYSVARNQAENRRYETHLLKVLGAPFGGIRRVFDLEFAILGFAASSCGAVLSLGLSFALTQLLFEGSWNPGWATPVIAVVGVSFASWASARLATRSALTAPAVELLQSE
jgi:putative ABC transport system permease protein